MMPDVDSLASSTRIGSRPTWTDDVSRIASHLRLRPRSSRDKAQKILDENLAMGRLTGSTTRRTSRSSRSTSTTCDADRSRPSTIRNALSYEKERANDARRGLEADRRSLIAAVGRAAREGRTRCDQAKLRVRRKGSRRLDRVSSQASARNRPAEPDGPVWT